ncbi:hypothetical protein [Paucibacter sp. M5-1]|uniref:hypothetical protein n=1 Tax=Paucibacter sp. M5-1 TaxID=3015998 RepID=UPI0022B8ABEE|nr:hypothetical protein [Paucibacter sp. M5-1]MCZ7883799.1 hypothetical protein [Paucibacter sp. M5-1]
MNITGIPKLAHCGVSAEAYDAEAGPSIMLTQTEGMDDYPTIVLHPDQLRAICAHFGLTGDLQASKTIATLQRRLSRLAELIKHLAVFMAECSDHEHADLSIEMARINALDDLAAEWCAEFEFDGSHADLNGAPPSPLVPPNKPPASPGGAMPVQQGLSGL